jgi:hypothetical protein
MKKLLFVVVFGLGLSACSLKPKNEAVMAKVMVPTPTKTVFKPVTVDLIQINKSRQDGIATITQEGNKTRVIIEMVSGKKGTAQPAHVHYGVCPKPGEVKYALSDVVEGKSDTLLDAPMEQIVASGSMAINVHKSIDEISIYVSCGDIKM